MSLNGNTLNSAALNGAALLVIIFAGSTGNAGASSAADPFRTCYGQSTATASVSASLFPTHTEQISCIGFAEVIGEVEATLIADTYASGTASCTSYIATFTQALAYAAGTGNASGLAIPADSIGESTGSCSVTGMFEATRIQHVNSSTAPSAEGLASGDIIRYVEVLANGECNGYADWQYKASGETTWLFDGHLWLSASSTGLIDETKYKVEVGDGYIATAESAAQGTSFLTQHMSVDGTFTSALVTTAFMTVTGNAGNTAGCTGSITATKQFMGTVNASGGSAYTQALRAVTLTHQARVAGIAGSTALVDGEKLILGEAEFSASITGQATGVREAMCYVDASAVVEVTMIAFSNYGVPAPDSRTMYVSSEDRTMIVSYEDRIMRKAA